MLFLVAACCMQEGAEALVWCKASCGNNAHKQCFDRWAAAKRNNGQQVTCVYCRAPWPDEGAGGSCSYHGFKRAGM